MKKGTLIPLLLFIGSALFGQTNNFSTSGNATMGALNYLKSGSNLYLQSTSTSSTNWSRGILSQNIYWDNTGLQWQIPGPVSDFGMIKYEDRGTIGFFSNQSTGSAYTLNNTDLEAYRRMTIMFNGNVGIGAASPSEPLTIASSNAFTMSLLRNATGGNITSGTTGGAIYFGSYDATATARYIGAMMRARSSENWVAGTAQGTALTFELAATGTTTLVERMRIDQNGNVGIGSTVPATRLEVKGTGRFINATTPTTGEGLEIDYAAGDGRIVSIDRTNTVYKNLKINASQVVLNDVSGGNVGIGTSTPAYQLHSVSTGNTTTASSFLYGDYFGTGVGIGNGSSSNYAFAVFNNINSNGTAKTGGVQNLLFVRGDGNVAIGSNNPSQKLDVVGTSVFRTNLPGQDSYIFLDPNSGFITTGKNATSTLQPLRLGVNNTEYMRISTSGNVGIGVADPGSYKLAVAGTVAAQAIKVTQTPWADYVFDDNYKLRPLSEVETYINQNKHLPDVPSAKEVTTNGIDLGDNQAVLLKKIEELTLYSIEQEKKNNIQNEELTALKTQLKEQAELLKKLTELVQKSASGK